VRKRLILSLRCNDAQGEDMAYNLNIEPRAERFLKKLKKKNSFAASVIAAQILELKRNPFTPRSKCDIVKVAGRVNEYRLRIGKVRAEYTINNDEINIRNIFIKKRKSDYR
jgi:mRNA-degrading endonuclease RelE of RelBE toxin-antitoxin system